MAKSPIQTVTENWQKRTRNLAQLGVAPDKFSELAQQDINKVAQGGTAMSDQEVYDAAISGAYNKPVIQDPARHHGLFDILGNIPKDIGDIATGFVPGAVNLIHHAPSEVSNLGSYLANTLGRSGQSEVNWEQAHGYEPSAGWSWSALAAGLRNVAKNPLVGFAPGISDVAAATTEQGRIGLEQHPVGALLNVFPDVGPAAIGEAATRIGYGGLASEVGGYEAAGQAAAPDISRSMEALTSGHPIRAGLRAYEPLSTSMDAFMQKFHIDPRSMEISRGGQAIEVQKKRELNQFISDHINPINNAFRNADGTLNDERIGDIYKKATDPRIPRSAEDETLINLLTEVEQKVAQTYKAAGLVRPITWNGTEFLFAAGKGGGPDAALLRAFDAVPTAEAKVGRAQERYNQAQADWIDKFGDGKEPQPPKFDKQNPEKNKDFIPRYKKWQEDVKKWESQKKRELKHVQTLQKRVGEATKSAKKANKHYQNMLKKTAPAIYHPMIEQDIRDRISNQVTTAIDPETGKLNGNLTLDEAFQAIQDGQWKKIFTEAEGYWSRKNFEKLKSEAAKTWQTMEAQGYHPMWVHTTSLKDMEALDRLRPLAHTPTPAAAKSRTLNFTPKITDSAVSLTHAASQYMRLQASEEFITSHLVPNSLTIDEVRREITPEVERLMTQARTTVPKEAIAAKLIQDKYVAIADDLTGGMVTPRIKPFMDGNHYLPKYLADAAREFTNPKAPDPTLQIIQRGNRIFKVSVLAFSPNFVAHHLLGGTLSLLGRSGYEEFLPATLQKAVHLASHPEELPARLSQGVDLVSSEELTSWLMGDKMGKLLHAAGSAANFNFKLVNFISNMQRAMAYLGEEQRGVKEGLSVVAARERGIMHANKVFVDWNGMAPIERQAIRTAIPFYGFTKQVLRYALTYPIDHPYRASVLSNLAEGEQADWTSGLPRSFMSLFFFGQGDNKLAVNYSTINPYRDIGNDFSLTGLLQSLNPFAKATLTASGLNTLGGTPELYPQVTYDPSTGQLVAKRPSDGPLSMLQSFIPEVGTIDHFLQLSSSMRRLAATNPTNYRRQLFSSLGVPFVPYSINIPYAAEKAELNRYKYAQQEASQATKTGSSAAVSNLNLVPYQGSLVTPNELQQILDSMAPAPPGQARKAYSTKKVKKVQPIAQGQQALEAVTSGQ